MAPQILRDYQQRAVEQITGAFGAGARTALLVLPTGGGKTTIFSSLASRWANAGARVLVLVHRRELATQASNRFREFGVRYGLILSGCVPTPFAPIQIASVQTAVRRELPPADYLVADEAHLSTAETWRKVLDAYPDAKILGCTATPWRLSGRPLAGTYERTIIAARPAELREAGHLCAYVGFAYKAPDVSKIERSNGDFAQNSAGAAMRAPGIVADVVEQWRAHASHLSTIVFASTVEHSQDLTRQFQAAGVRAEHLDGSTSIEARKAILARVERGETQVLCNVSVAVEGIDIPRLKCCVLARPTMSVARAIQMMGRVRRPWQGQTARIHDHAFVIPMHGLPDVDRDYTLGAGREQAAALPSLTTCPQCFALYSGLTCPACGVEAPPVERVLREVEGAERYDFESGIEFPDLTATERPPVAVRWTTPGRIVEGVFRGTRAEKAHWGTQKIHTIEGAQRVYECPGTSILDKLLAKARVGDKLRVTYVGEESTPSGHTRRAFRLEVVESAPDPEEESRKARDAEIVRLYCEQRLPLAAVGAAVGVSGTRVRVILKRMGIQPRDQSAARIVGARAARVKPPASKVRAAVLNLSALPIEQIMRRVKRGRSSVRKILRDAGIAPRTSRPEPVPLPKLIRLYRTNTIDEIRRQTGMSANMIYRRLVGAGVQMRRRGARTE